MIMVWTLENTVIIPWLCHESWQPSQETWPPCHHHVFPNLVYNQRNWQPHKYLFPAAWLKPGSSDKPHGAAKISQAGCTNKRQMKLTTSLAGAFNRAYSVGTRNPWGYGKLHLKNYDRCIHAIKVIIFSL